VALPARSRLRDLDFDELPADFGGKRTGGAAAVLDTKLDGFPDIARRVRVGIAVADAARSAGTLTTYPPSATCSKTIA